MIAFDPIAQALANNVQHRVVQSAPEVHFLDDLRVIICLAGYDRRWL